MNAKIWRAAERASTRTSGLSSAHCFSFGHAYDPENTHFGSLLAVNEDRVAPGGGYDLHTHRDTEILSWVLDGELTHTDTDGNQHVVRPGTLQLMSAGGGVAHSERNEAARELHFVQMWVRPDELGGRSTYRTATLDAALAGGRLVRAAAGHPQGSELGLRRRDAALWIARPHPGSAIALPEAAFGHLMVVRGAVLLEGVDDLAAGDSLRYSGPGGELIIADDGAEILLWQMGSDLLDAS